MRIAISQRIIETKGYSDKRDALSHDWIIFLQKLFDDCNIFPLPNRLRKVDAWLDDIEADCLILSNGNDWGTVKFRDDTEFNAIGWAVEKKIPVLGVCRGFQVINKYFGGKISMSISAGTDVQHVAAKHAVHITSKLFSVVSGETDINVNSYHNHGVYLQDLSENLRAFSMAEDDIVEGIYHPELSVLAVQWHPERHGCNDEFNLALLKRFLQEGKFW